MSWRSTCRIWELIFALSFSSWIGWFPVLFYTSLWVNEIYVRENPGNDQSDAGIRAGNRALLYSSLIAMVAIIVMPFFVIGGNGPKTTLPSGLPSMVRKKDPWWKCHVANLWVASNFIFACAMGATLWVSFCGQIFLKPNLSSLPAVVGSLTALQGQML